MANENFLLLQKPTDATATSTETWGIYLTAMPMLDGRERKELEANDWLDEHGDDPYFGTTIKFKAFDATIKCAVKGTMGEIHTAIDNLLNFLTTGGTEVLIYSSWVARGRTKVSFQSISEPDYSQTGWPATPFVATFDLVLHISNPTANVTCATATGGGYTLSAS